MSDATDQAIVPTPPKNRPWLFQPGHAGPGRPKGLKNKQTSEQREFAQAVCYGPDGKGWDFAGTKDADGKLVRSGNGRQDFIRLTAMQLYTGLLSPAIQSVVYFYLLGKPIERVEVREVATDFTDLTIEQLRERAARIAGRVSETLDMERESDSPAQ